MRPPLARRTIGMIGGLQHVVEAVEVGAQHGVPFLAGHRRKGVVAGDAGIENDAVVGAVAPSISAASACAQAGAVGDVEADHAATSAAGARCRPASASAPALSRAVVDDDVEAVMRQAPGDGAADALAGAGDEDRAGHELAGLLISLETSCGW